jgi:Glucose / Sorbosone dehydrogenase
VQADAQGLPSGFARTQIAQVNAATRMAFAPDGRIFVAELGGRLRVIKNGALLATPFLTVNVAGGGGERGLAGVVLDPNFAANHYVYVYYTARTPTIHSRVSRFTANGDVAVPGSEHIILELDTQTATIHNAGAMKFWHDGTLFISVGENTTPSNAQDMTKLLGKLLRIEAVTIPYRAIIRSAPCRAHAPKFGRMAFATPGAWQSSAGRIGFSLTTWAVVSLKKSMKAKLVATMAGHWLKVIPTTPTFVPRFLHITEIQDFQSDAQLSAARFTILRSKNFLANTSASTSLRITATGGSTFWIPQLARLVRLPESSVTSVIWMLDPTVTCTTCRLI